MEGLLEKKVQLMFQELEASFCSNFYLGNKITRFSCFTRFTNGQKTWFSRPPIIIHVMMNRSPL